MLARSCQKIVDRPVQTFSFHLHLPTFVYTRFIFHRILSTVRKYLLTALLHFQRNSCTPVECFPISQASSWFFVRFGNVSGMFTCSLPTTLRPSFIEFSALSTYSYVLLLNVSGGQLVMFLSVFQSVQLLHRLQHVVYQLCVTLYQRALLHVRMSKLPAIKRCSVISI